MAQPRLSVRKPKDTTTARRISCIACGLVAPGVSDKLCVECAKDIWSTRSHVVIMMGQYEANMKMDWTVLEQAIPDDLSSPLYERWCAYQQAIADNTDADKMAVASINVLARAGRLDPLLDLIRLWLAYTDAKAVYQEREQWAERVYQAIREIDTREVHNVR